MKVEKNWSDVLVALNQLGSFILDNLEMIQQFRCYTTEEVITVVQTRDNQR